MPPMLCYPDEEGGRHFSVLEVGVVSQGTVGLKVLFLSQDGWSRFGPTRALVMS